MSQTVLVQNISPHGIWLLLQDKEFFMSFEKFPWFLRATIEQIYQVEIFHGHHLHWPALDIDVDVDALCNPEKYPLQYSA